MRIVIILLMSMVIWMGCSNSSSSAKKTISGFSIYQDRCAICHGNDGKMGMNGAKDLTASPLNMDERIQVVTNGRNIMPAFNSMLSKEEIQAAAEYTMSLK